MTSLKQRQLLKSNNFKLIESSSNGIYRHETFESDLLKFVLVLDKAYHECYVYGNNESKRGGSILKIMKEITNNENFMESELSNLHKSSRLTPEICIKILLENYESINQHLNVEKI